MEEDKEVEGWVVWHGFGDPDDDAYPYFQPSENFVDGWVRLSDLKYGQELRAYADLVGREEPCPGDGDCAFSKDLIIPKHWLERKT